MARALFIFVILGIISQPLLAQDNYARQEYGAVSTFTGGAAIASVRDNAAIYYNPGALGLIDSASFSINSDVYGFDFYNLKNDAGQGLNMKDFKTDIFPQIAAGSFEVKKAPRMRISYGTLTRFTNDYKFDANTSGYYNVIPNSGGPNYYNGQAEYELSSIEQWAGMGLAYKITNAFSLGMSLFGTYLDYEAHSSMDVSADAVYNNQPYTASVYEYNGTDIKQINGIVKMGGALDLGRLKLGGTITLPAFRLWSRGSIDKVLQGNNLNYHNPDSTSLLFRQNSFSIADEADKLQVHYYEPAAFSLGASYQVRRWTVHLSAEVDLGRRNHTLMSTPATERIQPLAAYPGDTIKNFMIVQTNIRPVLNGGIGFEYAWQPNFSILCGVRTDFSNREQFLPNNDNLGIQTFVVPTWDYLHFSLGGSYKTGPQIVTAGLNYGIGIPVSSAQSIDLSQPLQALYLRGSNETNTSTSVHYLTFILGYTYYFKK